VSKRVLIFIAVTLYLCTVSTSHAVGGDDILGIWINEEKDAKIEVFRCGEKYCGRITALNEPNYPAGSKDGVPGTPRLDHNNPDPAKRSKPIIGLLIMNDFVHAGDNAWKGGTVYDPKVGKTYRGKMTLVSPNTLVLRGYVGIPLFGRSSAWERKSRKEY
jgi:uncharacterized protein (DUF2147 family)